MGKISASSMPVNATRQSPLFVLFTLALLVLQAVTPVFARPLLTERKKAAPAPPAAPRKIFGQKNFEALPLSFEANRGQMASRVPFLARHNGYRLSLAPTEATLSWGKQRHRSKVKMNLLRAHPQAAAVEQTPLPGVSNYLLGNAPKQWRTNVPHFAQVKSDQVYPGVDQVYYSQDRQLEYDLVVAPGINPDVIQLACTGASDKVCVTYIGGSGRDAGYGIAVDSSNQAYVTGDSATGFPTTSGAFRTADTTGSEVFVTKFVSSGASLLYSTLLGGDGDETGYAIALDSSNHAIITGETTSTLTNFDLQSAIQGSSGSGTDAFVAKLNSTATSLLFSTYYGGSNTDSGRGIAVSGSTAYFAGFTSSAEYSSTPFPIVPDANQSIPAYQYYFAGGVDSFIAKITGL